MNETVVQPTAAATAVAPKRRLGAQDMFTISKLTTGLPFQGRGGTCHGAMHCISGVMGCVVLGSDTTATPLSKGSDQDISFLYK